MRVAVNPCSTNNGPKLLLPITIMFIENPGNLKPGKNKPGRIIKFTQIWILEEELDSDEDVHVDLVVPLLETHEIN